MKMRTFIIVGVGLWVLVHGALLVLEVAAAFADALGF